MNFHAELLNIFSELSQEKLACTGQQAGFINHLDANLGAIVRLFHMLADEKSQKLLMRLLRHRWAAYLLADARPYAIYSEKDWAEFKKQAASLPHMENDYILDRIETYILEGYRYDDIVKTKPGDYVLDCGAFTGNTAVYFADRCGADGRVFSFEPMPETFAKLKANIAASGRANIEVHNCALTQKSATVTFTAKATAGSRMTADPAGIQVQALSIDDFARKHALPRLDLIKMDIEGAELEAICGAARTIREHRPDLAICVYHKVSDLIDIPAKIREICPDYRFYLKHNSHNFWETVLFATVRAPAGEHIAPAAEEIERQIAAASRLWHLMRRMAESMGMVARQPVLAALNALATELCQYKLRPVFSPQQNYLYYPLSDDDRLHFEFLFSGNEMLICLHLEGQWEARDEVFADILANPLFRASFTRQKNIWSSSLQVKCGDMTDLARMARLMNMLINEAVPALARRGLLGSRFVADNFQQLAKLSAPALKAEPLPVLQFLE